MRDQTKRSAPSDDDSTLIFELFAKRQESYAAVDVLRLTGTSKARLAQVVEEEKLRHGELEWEDAAELALERWTPRMLHTVLADLLPPLNRTALIPVELPVHQIRVLHALAISSTRRGNPPLNASDVLERAIHQYLVPEYFETVRAAAPEIKAAAEFPLFRAMPRLLRPACRYCGALIRVDKEACTACVVLHEPSRVR
jgi:hypothetical protein